MGLGLHGGGVGAAKFFAKAGAQVLVTDLRQKEQLKQSLEKLKGLKIKFVLGQHRPEDFINTDLVIKNPAVPETSKYLEIAKNNKVAIDSDIGIFFEICKNKKIGITGTKGKSTTTKLIFELVKTKYKNAVLAGNIRISILEIFKKIVPKNPVVLELSSWQLHDLAKHKKSPTISVVLNILNDHQNRYKNFNAYIEDKKYLVRFQKSKGFAVLNFDDLIVRDFAKKTKAQVLFFSADPENQKQILPANLGCFLKEEVFYFGPSAEKVMEAKDVLLPGRHNLSNVAAAITVAKILEISNKDIKKIIKKFEGLPGRLELIARKDKKLVFNDTTATTPDATLASLAALKEKFPEKPITLVLGGTDKKLDFKNLAQTLKNFWETNNLNNIVFLPGDATEKIKEELKKINFPFGENNVIDAFEMSDAIKLATATTEENGVILLSPAAASFGLFAHEFDRGQKFTEAINKYL